MQSILSLTNVPRIVDELIKLKHSQPLEECNFPFKGVLTLTRSELIICACCQSLAMDGSPGDALWITLIASLVISRAKTNSGCESER